jgi:hypothetical protein
LAAASGDPGAPAIAGEPPSLGTIAFVPDPANRKTVAYPAEEGGPVSLSVTDAHGATWTLEVPDGSLLRATEIAMTPFASIDASSLPGPVLSGVLLEPEGTAFSAPAILTVSGVGLSDPAILQSDKAGNVRLAMRGGEARNSVSIWHFSGGVAVNPGDPGWAQRFTESQKDELQAKKEAASLQMQPVTVPQAPSVEAECRDDAAWSKVWEEVSRFQAEVLEPETGLITRMLTAAELRQRAGGGDRSDFEAMRPLVGRLLQKVGLLLKDSAGQPDKVLAVSPLVIRILKQAQLLGMSDDNTLAQMGEWMDSMLDGLIEKIRDEHDYTWVEFAWTFAKESQLLGGRADVSRLLERLRAAFTFKTTVTFDLTMPRHSFQTGVHDLKMTPLVDWRPLAGKGTGDYLDHQSTYGEQVETTPFTINLKLVDVDFCTGTAWFGVDRMAGKTETYILGEDMQMPLSLVKGDWEALFKDRVAPGRGLVVPNGEKTEYMYAFEVHLHNKEARWVQESYEGEATKAGNKLNGVFEVIMDHAPAPDPTGR